MGLGLIPFPSRHSRPWARASLVTLWLLTAAVSLWELQGRGQALLVAAGTPAPWQTPLIVAGSLLDLAVGLALWRWHRRWVYRLALLALLGLSLTATLMLPTLWLDPLGCLSKNLPIAALLFILHQDAPT